MMKRLTKNILLIIATLAFLYQNDLNAQDTYADNFGTASYNNNDGNQNWSSDWIENDFGGTNPSAGRIRINSNQLRFRNFDSNSGLSIRRDVDLSSYSSATLTFNYNRSNGDESVGVYFFNPTTLLYEFATSTPTTGSTTGSITFNIPTTYLVNTTIFFFSASGNWGNNETVFIDNVLITATSQAEISINDITVDEDAGNATFTVTHSGANTSGGFSVEYATSNNTAIAPDDYTATGSPNPTISFSGTAGETQTITIPITDDNFAENTESFFVDLLSTSNLSVNITDNQGIGTINDDDIAEISINNVTVNEADGNATLTVTLSGANLSSGFSVEYATEDGSATQPNDYTATGFPNPTINFAGNINETQTITIPIIDDSDVENDHNFFINLSNISNTAVSFSDNRGEITITDNDAGISIDDISVNETAGTATFMVTLTGANIPGGFSLDYATADNSANAGTDYTNTSGTINFVGNLNETQTISVPILDDSDLEGNETFFINLSNLTSGSVTFTDNQGQATIVDDETPFIITDGVTVNTCSGVFVDSGSISGQYSNNEAMTYTICPSTPGSPILVNFTDFDVETFFDGLFVYEGTTTTTLIGGFDNGNPPTSIISSDPSGCLTFVFTSDFIITGRGWEADIYCADSVLTVNNVTVSEDAGFAVFTVTHSGNAIPGGFSIQYNTEENTAFADSDFTNTSGTLNFSGTPGEVQLVVVPIINNVFGENTENFFLNLSNPSVSNIAIIRGTGTITDDGDTPLTSNVPLDLFDEFNGYFDYALTGGTFRDSDTDTCSIMSSSSNTLSTTILPGSTIEKAYLFWSHSGNDADDVVTFEGQSVTADIVNRATFGAQPYHGMVSDVTSIVQSIPDPSTNVFDVTDLKIDNTNDTFFYCGGNTTLGGWSLMVFYNNPTLPAVSINLYNGFDGQQNTNTNYTLSGFFAIGSSGSKTSVLSWEGDAGTDNNEILTITTSTGTSTLTGDGDNDGVVRNNPFNSTIFDNTSLPIINNTDGRGIDLDTYDISPQIVQGESSATTNVQVGGDFIILNAVLLKVPSNLIVGNVFEDINYPGGAGRDNTTASGTPEVGTLVELYDNTGTFLESDTTDASGEYTFGGMANGDYSIRVVNNTVLSNRGGGSACTTCLPVQTYKVNYAASTFAPITTEIGGANPSGSDPAAGTLTGAQSISTVSILNEGVVGIDFGFNFNTIVNTNQNGQGSLEQFIINANNLDETGLDIEANGIFDPGNGEDTSIFMIPPTGDSLGRTADANFSSGVFDINTTNLSIITADNTYIDGRTQTAYSGDTNTGTIGSGGSSVGVLASTLPNFDLPEIQVHQNNGDVFRVQGNNTTIRNLSIYADTNAGILIANGEADILENLIGVDAQGNDGGNMNDGVEITGGSTINIQRNFFNAINTSAIWATGGSGITIEDNHITSSGPGACSDNLRLDGGSSIAIQDNLIELASAFGIDTQNNPGGITITNNTIRNSGQDGGVCTSGINNAGIRIFGNGSSLTNNIINNNGGAGIVLAGTNTSGNLISQNSIYANGTASDALGIDIDNSGITNPNGDGVTLNDNGDTDSGPNGSLNFPVFESATVSGTSLRVVGWSRPGAVLEFFITDINQGTATAGDNQIGLTQDYGEGQIYIGSGIEGSVADTDNSVSSYTDADSNTDTTNKFNITITLSSSIPVGTLITATATLANSTSEFGNTYPVSARTVITNRRITYRVRPN